MTDKFASAFKDNYGYFKRHKERFMPNVSLSNSPQQACLTDKDDVQKQPQTVSPLQCAHDKKKHELLKLPECKYVHKENPWRDG